jgi:hypothetical protein
MKANLKVIVSVVGAAALQAEVLGFTAKAPPHRQLAAGHPAQKIRFVLT